MVERIEGTGMTDFYGALGPGRPTPEYEPMSEAACERKIALLRASWANFDDVASRVSPSCDRDRAAADAIATDRPSRQLEPRSTSSR